MSLMTFNFQSSCLSGNTEITVILPDKPWKESPADFTAPGRNTRCSGSYTAPSATTPTGYGNRTSSSTPAKRT